MFPLFGLESCVESGYQHGNAKVNQAVTEQINRVSYCPSTFFRTAVVEEAARVLVDSTGGNMARAYIVNSGESIPSPPQRKSLSDRKQVRKPWRRQ